MVASERDRFVDLLRSFSLVVVVVWHWVFTILVVSPETVSPSNPIGFTRGLWVATWLLQVMPVFFFVGGYTHFRSFRNYTPGTSRRFLKRRMGRLVAPALGLVAVWLFVGWVLEVTLDPAWVWSAVILVLSPLWFLVVYVVMVLIAPIAIRAHRRWGEIAAVWLLGLAGVLDVLRFSHGQGWAAWVNFLVIWGLAHQLGFFYDRMITAPPRAGWTMFWAGLFALVALTNMGFYPRSLVGVPGERFSNMGPPTLAIVALTILQVGLVLVVRPRVLAWLERGALKQLVDDPSLWPRIAREALRRCHAHPDTGEDQDGPGGVEPCEAACYDCLMSYSNQGDHALLDRRLAIEYLAPLTRGAAFARDEHDAGLAESAESGLEQQFLSFLERGGYRRPDRAQVYFETAQTRPDFVYDEACAVIYVDGPHHDYPERAARDAIQEQAMNDLGYQVIRFGHADDWQSIAAGHPAVFGLGSQ